MKAIFIAYNQAYYAEIVELLEANGCRGSRDGEPHLGNHAWPTLNNAVLAFVEDSKTGPILDGIREKDSLTPELGIRAFVWSVEQTD